MYTVYGDMLSGNCYKIKLLLRFLDIEHSWVHVDTLVGGTHTDAFRQMNPNARIPVIALPDGRYLWESNAILNYLALGSAWLPEEAYDRARVLQWQFFEQYSHEPHVAPEGGFSLDGYPAVRRWCADVEKIPGYVTMDRANA
jgi:glutathione S-transferase